MRTRRQASPGQEDGGKVKGQLRNDAMAKAWLNGLAVRGKPLARTGDPRRCAARRRRHRHGSLAGDADPRSGDGRQNARRPRPVLVRPAACLRLAGARRLGAGRGGGARRGEDPGGAAPRTARPGAGARPGLGRRAEPAVVWYRRCSNRSTGWMAISPVTGRRCSSPVLIPLLILGVVFPPELGRRPDLPDDGAADPGLHDPRRHGHPGAAGAPVADADPG